MKQTLNALLTALAGTVLAPQVALAQAPQAATPAASATAAAAEMTDAEVRKIDREAGTLTLRHGEIKNLDMPGMTMVFVVKDKAMLGALKAGDKLRFRAISEGGQFIVTEIQPVR